MIFTNVAYPEISEQLPNIPKLWNMLGERISVEQQRYAIDCMPDFRSLALKFISRMPQVPLSKKYLNKLEFEIYEGTDGNTHKRLLKLDTVIKSCAFEVRDTFNAIGNYICGDMQSVLHLTGFDEIERIGQNRMTSLLLPPEEEMSIDNSVNDKLTEIWHDENYYKLPEVFGKIKNCPKWYYDVPYYLWFKGAWIFGLQPLGKNK